MQNGSNNKILLTRDQFEEVQDFKENLKNGTVDIAFEGSFDEGIAFLNGLEPK